MKKGDSGDAEDMVNRLLAGSLLAAAIAASITACGSSGTSGGTGHGAGAAKPSRTTVPGRVPGAQSPGAQSPGAAGSEGCRRAAPGGGRMSFTVRGARRSYLLAVPEPPAGGTARPAPLIVNLHGLGSNALQQALYSRLPMAGPRRGFIIATPETAASRTGWKLPEMADGRVDIQFVGALLDHLERTVCVDRSREFAAGMSNGAGLSAALVCGLHGRLAGVGVVAGLNLARPCATKPTTIVAFHGTADGIVPYRGGAPFSGQWDRVPAWMMPAGGRLRLPAVEAVAAEWARDFGCGPRQDSSGSPEVRLRRYPGCRDGALVELFTVVGGGHTWPGSLAVGGLGRTTAVIDATDTMLGVFTSAAARR